MTANDEVRRLRSLMTAAAAVALATAGCTSKPFDNSSDFDRTFISAAQTWDVNKDGSVSCDEWSGYVASLFRDSDVNGDNALDATEFSKMARSDRLFEVANITYYDANGDGRVTLEEMTGKQNVAFRLLDKDGDCKIDRKESVQVYGIDKPKEKELDQNIPKTPTGR